MGHVSPNIATLPCFYEPKRLYSHFTQIRNPNPSLIFADSTAKPLPALFQTNFASIRDLRAPLDMKTLEFAHYSFLFTISGFRVSQGEDGVFLGVFRLVFTRKEIGGCFEVVKALGLS